MSAVKVITNFICLFYLIKLSLSHRSELLYNLAKLDTQNLTINNNCKFDLGIVLNGITNKEIWAMKLLDASGRLNSGFVWGNNYWLGSRTTCENVQTPTTLVLSKVYAKLNYENLTETGCSFPVEYRVLYARHFPKLQVDINLFDRKILHIGICFPQSCNDRDTMILASQMFSNHLFNELNFLNENTTALSTKTLNMKENFFRDTSFYLMLSIFMINLLLIIVSTFYLNFVKKQKLIEKEENGNNNDYDKGNSRMCSLQKFFICFSLKNNSEIITSDKLGKDTIEVIHGIRAIGMFWIIIGHIFYYANNGIENLEVVLIYADKWILQPLYTVQMAVDSYFLVSALLLSYLFFQRRKTQKQGNIFAAITKGVVNRYLRLTPPYVVVILLTTLVSKYLKDTSPFWITERNDENCSKYWWRNLLYINNLFPMSDMCMSWSWFLAVDFQCFVLTSILLNLYNRYQKLTLSIFGVIFIGATTINGYIGFRESFSISFDSQYKTIDLLYTPTSTRICSYFVGVLTGWYLSEYKTNKNLNLGKKFVICCWIIGPLLNLFLIFSQVNKNYHPIVSAVFPAFAKTFWAIGIAWVIIACTTGHGGIITTILQAKFLIPLSRMSYSAYLLNPLLIIFTVLSTEVALHLDFASLPIMSIGYVTSSFLLAYIFMLLFENPYVMLIRTYVERARSL